ncbi:S1C family serine protease [Stieleria varia]|nr:trypsin-like peptidase domain-containing protein [Stieleria varia]
MASGTARAEITLDPLVQSAEQERIAAINVARPSAVSVFVPGGGGGGSGVLISPDGYALTNFHVTSPAGTFMRCGLSDGNIYDAVLVGIDPVGDLAMIRLLGRDDFPYATIANSLNARAGDWCMVIGNPFLLASNLQPTVTWGILSGVGRYQYPSGTLLEYADCLQTDASINPGNSGGPIYDAKGHLLGIVGRASFEKRGRVNVGVGYAISINQAKNFLGCLRSGRIVDHATLGATVTTDPDGGVVVSNILESSDAFRRGLRYDSEIIEIDGRPVTTANDVQNVLGTLPSGWRVKLVMQNEGRTTETLVRLMGVHLQDELLEKMASALPPPPPIEESPDEKGEGPEGEGPEGEGENKGEGDNDGENAPNRGRDANPHAPSKGAAIPKAVEELITARHGYANYHFNEMLQTEFIDSLRKSAPVENATDDLAWVIQGKGIEGKNADGAQQPVNIRIEPGRYAMLVGSTAIEGRTKADLYNGVDAQTVGGILPALSAWRRMLRDGPKRFGESYYWGTMPLGGERPLRHCFVGIDGEMEIRWLYHPDTMRLECIEVQADRDEDPAELWVRYEGDKIAGFDLRYGLENELSLNIDSWTTEPIEPTKPIDAAADTDKEVTP